LSRRTRGNTSFFVIFVTLRVDRTVAVAGFFEVIGNCFLTVFV
jgi:hypothetical protein